MGMILSYPVLYSISADPGLTGRAQSEARLPATPTPPSQTSQTPSPRPPQIPPAWSQTLQPGSRRRRIPPPDGATPFLFQTDSDPPVPHLTQRRRSPHPSHQPADWPKVHRAPQTLPASGPKWPKNDFLLLSGSDYVKVSDYVRASRATIFRIDCLDQNPPDPSRPLQQIPEVLFPLRSHDPRLLHTGPDPSRPLQPGPRPPACAQTSQNSTPRRPHPDSCPRPPQTRAHRTPQISAPLSAARGLA